MSAPQPLLALMLDSRLAPGHATLGALLAACTLFAVGCAATTPARSDAALACPSLGGALFFYGVAEDSAKDHEPGLWVVDAAAKAKPRRLVEDTTHRPQPLARLDLETLLLAGTEHRLWVLDLQSGGREPVECEGDPSFIHARGAQAWFIYYEPQARQSFCSYSSWRKTRIGTLGKLDLLRDRAVILPCFDQEVSRVFCVKDDGLWVATEGDKPALWFVPLGDQAPREICALNPEWDARTMGFAFSPTGERLALGITDEEHRSERRGLAIVDLASGEFLRLSDDALSEYQARLLDSMNPQPYVPEWCSHHMIGFPARPPGSTGAIDPEDPYDTSHPDVLELETWAMATAEIRLGAFEVSGNSMVASGGPTPFAEVMVREDAHLAFPAQLSGDGRWLAIATDPGVEVVDALTGRRRNFTDSWVYCAGWMPRAGPIPSEQGPILRSLPSLHESMGSRIRVEGVAKHSRYGPCL